MSPTKRIWDDTKRALDGAKHRRATESERSTEEAVVDSEIVHGALDITKPTVEMLSRYAEDPRSPATLDDVFEVWERVSKLRLEEYASKQETADRILDVAGNRPPNARFQAIEFKMRIVWFALVIVGTLALGSIGAIAKYLYSSGGDEREREITIKNLLDHDADYARRIRATEDAIQRDNYRLDDRDRIHLDPKATP